MRASSKVVLAMALAAGLSGVPVGTGARASCGGTDFPFELEFEAYVDSVIEGGFVVDRLSVALPTASTVLPWDPSRYDVEIERSAIEAGAFVRVHGSLRPDGTVLAQAVEAAEATFEDGGEITHVSGILGEIDTDTITVDGHAYALLDEEDYGPHFEMTGDTHELALDALRVGDAVAFQLIVDEDSGDTVVARALVRPSGDGAVLAGRVTANTMETGGEFFGHSGLYFEVEGVSAFFPYNEAEAVRAVARGEHHDDSEMLQVLAEGDGVRMTGWYRDGVFFVEDLFVAGAGLQARAPRAVVAEGVVTRSGDGAVEVNGVSFRTPTDRSALRAARLARVGDRVRVRGGVPRGDGEPVAREIRRIRRR